MSDWHQRSPLCEQKHSTSDQHVIQTDIFEWSLKSFLCSLLSRFITMPVQDWQMKPSQTLFDIPASTVPEVCLREIKRLATICAGVNMMGMWEEIPTKYNIWQKPSTPSELFFFCQCYHAFKCTCCLLAFAVPDWAMRKSLSLPKLPF